MKWLLRQMCFFTLDWIVPTVVALFFLSIIVVGGTVLVEGLSQVATDIHTIAESVEKSD